MTDYISETKKLINSHKYFQFSANWCPDCAYANSIWDRFHIKSKIRIFDIGSLPQNEQEEWRSAFMKVANSRNLPTIFVDGQVWGTEKELHQYEKSGTLQAELSKIGLLP